MVRIHINKVIDRVKVEGGEPEVKSESEIEVVYDNILEKFGIRNSFQAEAYRSFLLSMPLRSQIQFLSAFFNSDGSWKSSQKLSLIEDNIINAFVSELYDKKVNVQLATSVPKFLNIIALKLLIDEKVLSEAYQLQPTMADKSLNSSLVALSFLISNRIKSDSSLIFDYFIRVSLPACLVNLFGYKTEKQINESIFSSRISSPSNYLKSKSSIEDLCKHANLFQDNVLSDSVGLIISYAQSIYRIDAIKNGIIPLYGFAETAKKAISDSKHKIDFVFKNTQISKTKKVIGYIPLSITLNSNSNPSIVSYSVLKLFGTIRELIRHVELGSNIESTLQDLSQAKFYAMPDFSITSSMNEAELDLEDDTNRFDDLGEFGELLKKWILNHPAKAISPHLLGKIFTRLFKSMQSIKVDTNSLGDLMNLYVISFFNSVLVEEQKEYEDSISDLSINNINTSVNLFINNLNSISSNEKLTLSKWLVSCPILLPFIDKDNNGLITCLSKFIISDNKEADFENSQIGLVLNYSVFSILKNVAIRGDTPIKIISQVNDGVSISKNNNSVIEEMRKQNAPLDLFIGNGREKYSQIAKKYAAYLGNDTKEINMNIKMLRKHIKDNNGQW